VARAEEPPAGLGPFHAPRIDEAQRRFWLIVDAMVAALVVVALVGGWAYSQLRGLLRELRAAGLTSLLEAEARGLQIWIDEKKVDAERWASTPPVRRAASELVRRAAEGTPCADAPQRMLEAQFAPFSAAEEVAVFNLVARDGRVVSSPRPEQCGREVAARFLQELAPVFEGRTELLRPWREGERLAATRTEEASIVWTLAPVRGEDESAVAALGFGRLAEGRFAKLLAISAPGTSRDAYAFDESGRMVTPGRHAGSAVREPSSGALTSLAEAAVARAEGAVSGVLLEPYRNYRGAEVIGAWRWLPQARMALAVEIEAGEAYGPLRHVEAAFMTLFALVLVAMAVAASTSLWAVRMRMREAKRIGPYRIEGLIGEGGMSHVYAGTHTLLGRPAAVKVLKPHLATDEAVERFRREAQLCSQLSHPNTVEVYDYGTTREGRRYYAMERLRGVSLEALVHTDGPMPLARVIHALRQTCASLREAHQRGWVHRDVKPGNLMLCVRAGEHDVLKVLDFGIAKSLRDPHTRDLTQHSKILGTPLYMAPERLRNPADADARADIYALAAVAWFAIAGRPPFDAETDHDIVYRVMNEPAPSLAAGGVPGAPPALEALLARCLAKEREQRPDDITEVLTVLEALAASHPWTEADARDWWQRRGDALAASGEPAAL
jgi:hypothetical protein